MKILMVGGSFDNNGGRESGLVNKITESIKKKNSDIEVINGGFYENLKNIIENQISKYDVVFWWANVPNELPKIRDVKDVAPYIMLVSSKRNDGDKYSFKELVARTLSIKANLTFEFKKVEDGKFNIMIFDPLGSCWYDGMDVDSAVESALNRLNFLMNITRQKTYQATEGKNLVLSWYFDRFKEEMYKTDKNIEVPNELVFVDKVKEYATVFQNIMKPETPSIKPILPPQVGRCGKGMPSFRKDGYVFVSKRNVDKQFITIEDFVPTYLEDEKVYYCGDKKPSVDTPIQLRLYEKLPNINYMIHSHCYIKNAPFTKISVPCGAVEEVDEVCKAILKYYNGFEENKYIINLIGHGSILLSKTIEGLDGVEYYGRQMPEKMF